MSLHSLFSRGWTGQAVAQHRCRAGSEQRFCRRPERRPRGVDVVDKENDAVTNAAPVGAERIAHVFDSLASRQSHLRAGKANAAYQLRRAGKAQLPAQVVGQQLRLIIPPLTFTGGMKRDRHEYIRWRRPCRPPSHHERREWLSQGKAPFIFKFVKGVGEDA